MHFLRYTIPALFVACLTTPAFAAETIKVTESGEGGGPMTLTLDKSSVAAGDTKFLVHNDAMSAEHEMVLVKLKSADEKIEVDTAIGRVDEDKLDSLGEVADLKPGAVGELSAKLTPGSYVLLCNIKGHFQAGMHAMLNVTK
ncbi:MULTISPECIES: hypothetical protein [unclassified Rhizobium]|uniref:hypothetical protein n=1 Tax=unclassified Rhizobium TaxID=2613769 RepID=UPI0007135C25|nr:MULTISPECIES: hypothetical protein [unclassified Rhizobium]KQT04722.1 copper resistance protein [Rhizobium sp. Leaf386]KQT05089.1 copper resistance protein [Rhizobium sp. Leaf391]